MTRRRLTIMSVPFSASFHLYSELFTLNLRDLRRMSTGTGKTVVCAGTMPNCRG